MESVRSRLDVDLEAPAPDCRACGGNGFDVDVEPICCAAFLPNGECCGQPIPHSYQIPCPRCHGSGDEPQEGQDG